MKRGITAVLAGALAAALLVPAAGAKPGNGNGNGNGGGPPAWSGGGGGGTSGGGKPEWAGAGKERGQAKKAERQAARGGEAEPGEPAPKHDNPAWICKFEREHMGAEKFAEAYGENENKANAFGKCVSQEAHDRDGVTKEDAEPPAAEEEADDSGDSADEEPVLPTSIQAFLHYLWPLLFQV